MENLFFVRGVPNNKLMIVDHVDPSIIVRFRGNSNFMRYYEGKYHFNRFLVAPNTKQILHTPSLIVNEISDVDSHSKSLHKLLELYPDTNYINHPLDILKTTRDGIYNLLKDIKHLNVPKVVRISPKTPTEIINNIKAELEYPVIIRETGSHLGENTFLVHSDDEVRNLFALPLDGREYYLIQYVDCVKEGIYEKTRVIVIDGELFIRHHISGTSWNVHVADRIFCSSDKKILSKFEGETKSKIKNTIDQITQLLGLDFYGIDCRIDGEEILVFEINATMNFLSLRNSNNFSKSYREILKTAANNMIDSKINSLKENK